MKNCSASLLLTAAAAVLLLCLPAHSDTGSAPVKTAIFEFTTQSQDDLTYIRRALPALLASRITMPKKTAAISPNALRAASGTADIAALSRKAKKKAAQSLGAHYMLYGTITKIGGAVSIDAVLADVQSGDSPVPLQVTCSSLDDVIPQTDTLAEKIKRVMIEGPPMAEHEGYARGEPEHAEAAGPQETGPVPSAPSRPTVHEEPLSSSPPAAPEPSPRRQTYKKQSPIFNSAASFTCDITGPAFRTLASGDVDGDGGCELLCASREKIHIFRSAGGTLKNTETISAKMDENIVHISAADINGNGINEIYASSYEGHYGNSFVTEYRDNSTFTRLADSRKWFFRTLSADAGGQRLIGQQVDLNDPFSGSLYNFTWKGNELVSRDEIIVPGGIGIYSYDEVDIDNDGTKEYIGFNKGLFSASHQLTMLSYTGRVLWRDTADRGGTPRFFIRFLYGDETEHNEPVPLRIICSDVNSDGTADIIIGDNRKKGGGVLKTFGGYEQGVVVCLHWDGAEMAVNWQSPAFADYVCDYILADIDNDSEKELVVLSVAAKGFFGKHENKISVFEAAD